ncbi:hypothetical protein H0H92_012932 [Tricholoma furcatifolium]|nr:hypothetical protein H0H92_012932 [Tricholoma furcatifolium]
MSAIRASGRSARLAQSPYARQPAKKSSWSISAFFRSLNPWSSAPKDDDEAIMQEDDLLPPNSPAVSLRDRGYQIEREIRTQEMGQITPPRTPLVYSSRSQFDAASPEPDLETVSARIRESLGHTQVQKLCEILQNDAMGEISQLITLKKFATQLRTEIEPQPFRFSTNPSTPARSTSPYQANVNVRQGLSLGATGAAPSTSRKTLSKNPNGVYRWHGGGSAKKPLSKNRYSSPAFGPSRSTPDRLILKDTQAGIDTPNSKRRKVAGELSATPNLSASSSVFTDAVPQPIVRASAPESSPTRVKQTLPFPASTGSPTTPRTSSNSSSNGISSPSTSRLRPPQQKPTLPVVPSPLRQAWSGASPPSRNDDTLTTPAPIKQTKAANYMTELIKEVTPPKRPDLSNPYQAASPLGKVATIPKGRLGRRVRATGKPAAPTAKDEINEEDTKSGDKEKVYSPQAIIEATLPKGSKRSRPPAQFEKSSSLDGETETSPTRKRAAAYVEDASDEDDKDAMHTSKKSKSYLVGNGTPIALNSSKSSSDMVIEEVESVNDAVVPEKPQSVTPPVSAPSSSSAAPGRSLFGGFKSTSAPKEPSKLRYSYQPDAANSPSPVPSTSLHGVSPPSVSSASPTPISTPFSFPAPTPTPAPPAFPSYTPPSIPSTTSALAKAPPNSLPSSSTAFSFSGTVYKLPPSHGPPSPTAAREAALTLPRSSLPSFIFTIDAKPAPVEAVHIAAISEAKRRPKFSIPQFDFSSEALQNVISSAAGRVSSSTPSTSSPAAVPFNWAGAGIKPPAASNDWTCSLCMLTNPSSATEQCEHCETKRPAPVASTAATQGFNWTAAGMKPPTTEGDTWTCSLCMLTNPNSATVQCEHCETKRPAPAAPPVAATQGFNWAAAGMKPPTTGGDTWTCSLCMLTNPNSATVQCEHCETKRPAPPAPPATQGFDWAAAGMKPPTTGDSWTCSLCGLSNPPSATSKCDTCDNPRS